MEGKPILNICILLSYVLMATAAQADAAVTTADINGEGNYSSIQEALYTQEEATVIEVTELGQINTSLQEGPVFLRLGAEWCSLCQSMKPIMSELAAEYEGKATIMSADIDQNPELKTYFGVKYIPDSSVIVGIEDGEYVYMQENGNVSKDRSQARIVRLKSKQAFERLLNLSLLNEKEIDQVKDEPY